ncbi:hypothetical protein IOD16_34895 [Saccharothrix sp. 6-C]|uniref:hypothetical protein n=1 Tax=Saccharothrix sp. 6-C TaxID=2781735 RepID=UPI001916DCE8|nr:hypothetical protein [Saccharothrix sp. 6-C]QQQ76164.1 hypothetical protein IOD16_34895 [Saccharothrix sp. 6-C]
MELANSEDPAHLVRAELIRELILGRRGALDPRGIRLVGARIVGVLDLDHVHTSTSLRLADCTLAEPLTAYSANLSQVNLQGSYLPGFHADGLRVDGNLFLRGATVRGSGDRGAIRLLNAHVRGVLDCDEVEIGNNTGPALSADRLRVDSGLFLRGATVHGSGGRGAIRLLAAHVSGPFECDKAEINNDTAPALHADGLRVDGNLFLRGATVRGSGDRGAIRLLNAHVRGVLDCDEVEIGNNTGPALSADRLRVDSGLFLRGATVRGSGDRGAIRLLNAHVSGQLACQRLMVGNDTGTALVSDGLRVDGNLFLRGATVRGNGDDGGICLANAYVGGELGCQELVVSNTSGLMLDLGKARVEGTVFLPASVVCPDASRSGDCGHQSRVDLDGFVFTALAQVDWRQWLHLVVHHTNRYSPQPYQQLAAIERAAGHDGNVRQVLIVQQDDLRRREPSAIGGRWARSVHRLWGRLAGYGYRARTLALALLLALAAAGLIGYIAGQVPTRPGHHAAERVPLPGNPTTAPGIQCSTIELIGLGLDRGLPLGATGLRTKCDLDSSTFRGQGITLTIWIIQAMLWGLITLAAAGYTNLIRKTL